MSYYKSEIQTVIKSRDLIVEITMKTEGIKGRRFTEGSDEGSEVLGDPETQTLCTSCREKG